MSRNKIERNQAKRLFSKPKGKLEKVCLDKSNPPVWMSRAYKNNRYVVMIEDDVIMSNGVKATKAMVQRHDDRPIPHHWREMQRIKNELFGSESLAIEYYPPESQLTDMANVYWLWVFQDGDIPVYSVT